MQKAKLDVLVAAYSYAGNGGVKMVQERLLGWFARVYHEAHSDERIGRFTLMHPGDVPLTMERNRVVRTAQENGYDVIWMLDNDNLPDLHLDSDPDAKPFFASSFDFLYKRAVNDIPSVVCAPYCGPPRHPVYGGEENVYVFQFETKESDEPTNAFRLAPYTRSQAFQMRGIQEIGAGPTGCILYTTDAFDLMHVRPPTDEVLEDWKAGRITSERVEQLIRMQSWFFYEFTDRFQTQKASTEDVTNTREIALAGWLQLRKPVVFCNWDSWAGHAKPKMVGKPVPLCVEHVSDTYRRAIEDGVSMRETQIELPEQESPLDEHELESTEADQMNVDVAGPEEVDSEMRMPQTKGVMTWPILIGSSKVHAVALRPNPDDLLALTNFVEAITGPMQDPAKVICVGGWVGEMAVAAAAGFQKYSDAVHVIEDFDYSESTIDERRHAFDKIHANNLARWFEYNTDEHQKEGRIRLCRGEQQEVAEQLSDNQQADILLLDIGWTATRFSAVLMAWLQHLSLDGWLCGMGAQPDSGVLNLGTAQVPLRTFEGSSLWAATNRDILDAFTPKEEAEQAPA